MTVTQDHIANHLGISSKTVMRALSGNNNVSAATRQRIVEAARELGYTEYSNSLARVMMGRRHGKAVKTGTIGVLIGGDDPLPWNDPYIAPVVAGISADSVAQGRHMALCLSGTQARPRLPWLIMEGLVDGIICVNVDPGHADALKELAIPTAVIAWDDHSVIVPQTRAGLKLATQHLIELGHRKIAYLGRGGNDAGPLELYHINERLGGYHDALAEARLPEPPSEWIALSPAPTAQGGTEAMALLLKKCKSRRTGTLPFTAIVCYNDAMAMGAIRHLSKHHIGVPQDLSVVGCDDISASYLFEPVITSVNLDSYTMGQRVMQLLGEHIDLDPENRPAQMLQEYLMPKLAVHDSTRRLTED